MSESNLERYKRCYSYKELLKKHSLDEEGVWEIRGEDPNCDFGGHHYQPQLGAVTGKLGDVIEAAVEMSNFWTWGCGGDIRPVKIIPVESLGKNTSLQQEKQRLQQRIKEIEAELKQ